MRLFLLCIFLSSSLYAYDSESYVVEINKIRSKFKLSPVALNTDLSQIAQRWSSYLLKQNRFDHRSDLRSFLINYHIITENLFKSNINPSPKHVINAWMNSSGHRDNLLDKETTIVGIGISNKRGVYIVVYNGADL